MGTHVAGIGTGVDGIGTRVVGIGIHVAGIGTRIWCGFGSLSSSFFGFRFPFFVAAIELRFRASILGLRMRFAII